MEDRIDHVPSDQAKKQSELEDRHNRQRILGFFAIVVFFVGLLSFFRDHSWKSGYRGACTDIANSNRMSDDCEIALLKGKCAIVCVDDTNIQSGDFEQLDPNQGDDFELEKLNQPSNNRWFWCWLHGGCINAAIKEALRPVEDQKATKVDCKNGLREDGSLVVECPATETSEAHQVIVPAR